MSFRLPFRQALAYGLWEHNPDIMQHCTFYAGFLYETLDWRFRYLVSSPASLQSLNDRLDLSCSGNDLDSGGRIRIPFLGQTTYLSNCGVLKLSSVLKFPGLRIRIDPAYHRVVNGRYDAGDAYLKWL